MLKKFDYDKIPVVDIVNEILTDASKRGASDIHFDPLEKYMKIRIRIDGELIDYTEVPNEIKKNLITRVKILSEMNITESRLPQDGAIKGRIDDVNLDLRVSALPTNLGEKIVVRILDYSLSVTGIDQLGFSENNLEKVLKIINVPSGIILVTGATGTGKSTTVYSILQRLNKENTNIITVEDPIEMNIEGINQVQTNSEIGLTFATALRSILRQDPNIIMIGEIRDTETARIAVRASITGHLVLSTIHTNNSLNTIERLLDMEVERYLLSSALTGIISQKLARKLCPKCRKLRKANDYEKQLFKRVLNKDIDEIYTAEGCDECSGGYKGRIALQEVLVINQEIRDAISNNIRKHDLRELVYTSDVTTLLQDGLEKVLDGYTTFEEVLKLIELDDEDLKDGHGLEKAINDTKLSQQNASDKKKKDKVEQENVSKEVEPEKAKEEKATTDTKSKDNKIKDNENKSKGKEMEAADEVDEKEENIPDDIEVEETKEIKDEEDVEYEKEDVNTENKEPEKNKKTINLESFLNEARNFMSKNTENKEDNNNQVSEEKTIDLGKEETETNKEEKTEPEFDDYGLSETINFINEYKKGLKSFRKQ